MRQITHVIASVFIKNQTNDERRAWFAIIFSLVFVLYFGKMSTNKQNRSIFSRTSEKSDKQKNAKNTRTRQNMGEILRIWNCQIDKLAQFFTSIYSIQSNNPLIHRHIYTGMSNETWMDGFFKSCSQWCDKIQRNEWNWNKKCFFQLFHTGTSHYDKLNVFIAIVIYMVQ